MDTTAVLNRLSLSLLNDEKIKFEDWLMIYKSKDDVFIHHLLSKCLARLASAKLITFESLLQINSHCLSHQCHFFTLLVKANSDCSSQTREWIELQVLQNCDDHCLCEILQLLQNLASNNQQPSSDLIVSITQFVLLHYKKCTLSQYLDLILIILSSSSLTSQMLIVLKEQFLSDKRVIFNILKEPIQPGASFKSVTSLILLRKYILIRLKLLHKDTQIDYIKKEIDSIERLLKQLNFQTDNLFVELFLDEDAKLLSALVTLFDIYFKLDEQMVHSLMNHFLNSISYDESILLDWMISDQDTATLLLELLLEYLKRSSPPMIRNETKVTLSQLFQKISSASQKNLFPFNPRALLKFADRLK